MKKTFPLAVVTAVLLLSFPAFASEGVTPPEQQWQHKSIFGTYDKAALQRGFQVYKEVCASCHSMKFVAYRNLAELGYTEEEIKSLAAEYTVMDGPNDEGEMFERPARPADAFKSPFANEKAARAANNGALPPDMSLLVKSLPHGEDYIYALLTGYEDPPADVKLLPGMNWNKYFPGHQLAMAQPLLADQVSYGDGTEATLEQEARDVAQFLAWTSEPHMEQRKAMGIKVILFLFAFIFIMRAAKRKVWSNVR